jgi:hypothetical protein
MPARIRAGGKREVTPRALIEARLRQHPKSIKD